MKNKIIEIAQKAKKASRKLGTIPTGIKNKALAGIAEIISEETAFLLKENSKDIKFAEEKGLSKAMVDRLTLNEARIGEMTKTIHEVIALPDPVGEIPRMWKRPNGLQIGKIRTPIGVIGIIYESRPNVTIDAASLCLKSGNAVILRGGSESIHSNLALMNIINRAMEKEGIPSGSIQMIESTDREAIYEMLKLDQFIDLIIPRGGHELIQNVVKNSVIPVIKHDRGICHVYVDASADFTMAEKICYNAKVQRPSVCNAMETLLVNEEIADKFLPLIEKVYNKAGVEIRGCEKTRKVLGKVKEAVEQDWDTEYLDLIISIKVVKNIDEAIEHINTYGTGLSEAIITSHYQNSQKFLLEVDAASVYINASTRFTDGNQFGLGTEMGISTQKLHARGPVGLEELTSYKYIIFGNGQIRE